MIHIKAIIVKQPGGVEQLEMVDYAKPEPKENELLIRVHASAVNRLDIITREQGARYYDHPILGVEVAGIVEKTVSGSGIEEGARVMGLVSGGGYAEYAVMPADRAMLIPENLSFEEAAAIPEVFLTAYQTLFWLGELQKDETVLIHAGGSGVGTAAIQLAKQLGQAKVIMTAGSKEKVDFGLKLGADVGINYKEQSFDQEVMAATDKQGVDLILDFVGASYWEKNMASIKVDGRWILIGFLGGSTLNQLNIEGLIAKRIKMIGTTLSTRSDEYKARLSKEFMEKTNELFTNKKLQPIVDKVFPLADIKQAHQYMEANKNIGKIILTV